MIVSFMFIGLTCSLMNRPNSVEITATETGFTYRELQRTTDQRIVNLQRVSQAVAAEIVPAYWKIFMRTCQCIP